MTKLKQMRMLKGVKQKELAQKMNIKAPTVVRMEQKGIYDTRTAAKYAKALNCNPVFLLEGLDFR